MQLLILFVFTFFTISLKAQIVEHRVEKFIIEQSIDSFIIYSLSCAGYISIDSCDSQDSNYLFWKQDGNCYLKRFDYSKTFKHVRLDSLNPLNFYLKNRKVIDKEQIKQPTYFEVKKTNGIVDTLRFTQGVSHSCQHHFAIPESRKLKYKSADTYDLDVKIFENGKKNIYYNYNQKTKLKALIDLTTCVIEEMKVNSKFESE